MADMLKKALLGLVALVVENARLILITVAISVAAVVIAVLSASAEIAFSMVGFGPIVESRVARQRRLALKRRLDTRNRGYRGCGDRDCEWCADNRRTGTRQETVAETVEDWGLPQVLVRGALLEEGDSISGNAEVEVLRPEEAVRWLLGAASALADPTWVRVDNKVLKRFGAIEDWSDAQAFFGRLNEAVDGIDQADAAWGWTFGSSFFEITDRSISWGTGRSRCGIDRDGAAWVSWTASAVQSAQCRADAGAKALAAFRG
jgi:hypothetical protein